jgi:hypothetical protein
MKKTEPRELETLAQEVVERLYDTSSSSEATSRSLHFLSGPETIMQPAQQACTAAQFLTLLKC